MPIVDKNTQQILKASGHDYSKLEERDLKHIVKSVSQQDAGNYDGKFVGMVAMTELILRENKKTQKWTMAVAILSFIVSLVALFKEAILN